MGLFMNELLLFFMKETRKHLNTSVSLPENMNEAGNGSL